MQYSVISKVSFHINKLSHKLLNLIEHKESLSSRQMLSFGFIMCLNFPLYYFIWHNASTQAYENLTLRLSASFFCFLLVLKNYWPKKLSTWLPFYWYFTILYCLPFFFTFMVLKNNASTLWLMNSVSVLFFLLLLLDWLSATLLLVVGAFLGWLCFILTATSPFNYNPGIVDFSGVAATLLAAFIIGAIFSHNNELIRIAKLNGMAAAGSTIAHEMRTPLASINSAINGLKKYFPALLDAYLKAEKSSIDIPKIPPKHHEKLLTLLDDIQSELLSANTIINMLLQNIKLPELKIGEFSPCLMSHSLDDAINRYPFSSDKQAQLIHLDYKYDFSFMGNQLLMIHILFNLIKNALYAIDMTGKGEIHIWTECDSDKNILYFRDTGKGISPAILPKLFDRFFTTSSHGTGLGLSFSKRVMQAFGGDITCESVEGEFTLFKLSFPVVEDKQE